ncbi:MAG TPA: hypothetical protein VFF26_01065 [Gallionella sp.]|nr:hypothetical protein [Gallionella sp.]
MVDVILDDAWWFDRDELRRKFDKMCEKPILEISANDSCRTVVTMCWLEG